MKRWFPIVLTFVLLLSLVSCGNGRAPSSTQAADVSGDLESTDGSPTPVTTEEDVRALYAADYEKDPTLPAIASITAYQGDFLVQFGSHPADAKWLDWVYGQSGIRRRMMFLDQELLDLKITGPASVEVTLGGENIYNGVPSFPHVKIACLNLCYDELGMPLDYDFYSSAEVTGTEDYWARAGESWPMGMAGRREAIRSAQLDAGGVTVAFAPLADGSDFTSAYCEIPYTTVALSEDNTTLTITMQDTFLDSGDPKDALGEPLSLEYLKERGSLYPEDFPAGELTGNCVLVEKAVLDQKGEDALLILSLNTACLGEDGFFRFTADTGYTGIADDGPYLRVQLNATNELFAH